MNFRHIVLLKWVDEEARRLGATRVEAALGPCIRPGCYEFGRADLDRVVARDVTEWVSKLAEQPELQHKA